MNTLHKKISLFIFAALLLGLTGCKKYLEEYNPAGRTAETYFGTPQGFEDLVRSNYAPLRSVLSYGSLFWLGTDAFSSGITTIPNDINIYGNNLNSALADVDGFWKQLYYDVQLANITLEWSQKVPGMDSATLKIRTGETKTLRAFNYYLLAETWGDVPLVLTSSKEPAFGFARAPEQQVYDQVIKDLNEAIAVLPATSTTVGRVTKGVAQHLLAKVYLTRATKSYGGGPADFTKAAEFAEAVISNTNYSLVSDFSRLFDPTVANFQVNPEVIFSVQYSTNAATNQIVSNITNPPPTPPVVGNNLHQNFNMDVSLYPAIGRTAFYNRANLLYAPTPWFISIFDKVRDSRYQATFHTVIYAQQAGGGFNIGDTVIYFPDVPWTAAQKAAVKYYVYNPSDYNVITTFSNRSFPTFKKFREIGLAFADNLGTRDTYVFRLAETYLMAAEAYLKLGNLPKALQYFNAVRTRAGKIGTNPATGIAYKDEMKVSSLTIDGILDERARELAGEELRWFELKRTGTLVTRVLAYNDEAKAAGKLNANFLLRPIPQSQIDLNRAEFPQNKGY